MCLQIDIGDSSIDRAASLKLIAAMEGKSMKSIGMAGCNLQMEGAKAMAKLVSVTPSLTKISLAKNELGEEGGRATMTRRSAPGSQLKSVSPVGGMTVV